MERKKYISYIKFAGIVSITLGLAPFFPEPHILGKIRWLWGGAVGMEPMDWFDLFLHGIPWLVLLTLLLFGFFSGQFVKDRN